MPFDNKRWLLYWRFLQNFYIHYKSRQNLLNFDLENMSTVKKCKQRESCNFKSLTLIVKGPTKIELAAFNFEYLNIIFDIFKNFSCSTPQKTNESFYSASLPHKAIEMRDRYRYNNLARQIFLPLQPPLIITQIMKFC